MFGVALPFAPTIGRLDAARQAREHVPLQDIRTLARLWQVAFPNPQMVLENNAVPSLAPGATRNASE
jgi:hypothetical protein